MNDHNCQHEGHIATILERTENTDETLSEISKDMKNIYKILNGNGSGGIITKVALCEEKTDTNKKSILKIWTTLRFFVLPIVLLILGICIKIVLIPGIKAGV